AALAFVVTGARPDRAHRAAVAFALRVDVGLAVHLAGGGLENPRSAALSLVQDVERAIGAGPDSLFGIALVVLRRCAAREVENPVGLHAEGLDHIVFQEREISAIMQRGEVAAVARGQVVDRRDAESVLQQLRAQVAAEETGSTGHDRPLSLADVRRPLRGIHSRSSLLPVGARWVANCMPPG